MITSGEKSNHRLILSLAGLGVGRQEFGGWPLPEEDEARWRLVTASEAVGVGSRCGRWEGVSVKMISSVWTYPAVVRLKCKLGARLRRCGCQREVNDINDSPCGTFYEGRMRGIARE